MSQLDAFHSNPPFSDHIEVERVEVSSHAPQDVSSQKVSKKRGRSRETVVRSEVYFATIHVVITDVALDPNARRVTSTIELNSQPCRRQKLALEERSLSLYLRESLQKGLKAPIGLLSFFSRIQKANSYFAT